ncbi:gliding motility-associated C-terminal domain-containing protein, partial [Xanthovirga aplysinae]|uniref:T9SS type B sorting domain-containing protein n=1 Tax=Xanthovirga aplysinae TaxID=2529853 RepID=UPI0012BD4D23
SPELNLPNDITVSVCKPTVEYRITASDNCQVKKLELIEGIPSGHTFPLGVTMVKYQATDVQGNIGYGEFKVIVKDLPNPPQITDISTCKGETVILAVENAKPFYSYIWYDSQNNVLPSVGNGSSFISGELDSSVLYRVVTKDKSTGCESTPIEVNVTVISTPNAPTASNQTFSSAEKPQIKDLEVNGETGATFIWYNASTGGSSLELDEFLTDGATYYVSQMVNGCESPRTPVKVRFIDEVSLNPPLSADFSILILENTSYSFTEQQFVFSDGDGDNFEAILFTRLVPNGNLTYDGKPVVVGVEYENPSLLTFAPEKDGFGSPYGSLEFKVKDNSNDASTTYSATYSITINVRQRIVALDDAEEVRAGETLSSSSVVENDENPEQLQLVVDTHPLQGVAHGNLILYEDGTYTYTPDPGYIGTDSFVYKVRDQGTPESFSEAQVIINIYPQEPEPGLGISPNGDGQNDYWEIKHIETYPNNVVSIFNRWGNLVYKVDQYNNEDKVWRGESNRGLTPRKNRVQDGTYFYVIEFSDGKELKSGYVLVKQ